jgi:hypothetical protein
VSVKGVRTSVERQNLDIEYVKQGRKVTGSRSGRPQLVKHKGVNEGVRNEYNNLMKQS